MDYFILSKLIIAILIFLLFSFIALINKNKVSYSIKWITGGIFLAIFILIYLPEKTDPLLRFFLTLQSGTLDADYSLIFENSPDLSVYKFFLHFFCVLAPLAFGGFILSFFEPLLDKISFLVCRKKKNVYFFYDFSEQIFELAKDIKLNDKKALLVFVNISKEDSSYITIKGEGFLIIQGTYNNVTFFTNNRCYYFLLSQREDVNITYALGIFNGIHEKSRKIIKDNYKIYIALQSTSSEMIFDSLDKGLIEFRIFNCISDIVQNFFIRYPMFNYITEQSNELVILGNGNFANEILKASLIYGNLSTEYHIKHTVIVDSIKNLKLIHENENPDSFLKEFSITVKETDFSIENIKKNLELKNKILPSIIICTEDSINNLNIACKVRELYLRKNYAIQNLPEIFIYNNNKTISSFLNENNKLYKGITAFGADNAIYSYRNIIDNPIDKIALNIQAVYEKESKFPKEKIIQNYYKNETNKRSCKSNAIHLFYKLNLLGFKLISLNENQTVSDDLISELKNKLTDEKVLQLLGELEHLRWAAFERTEGWQKASIDDAIVYSKITGNHKYSMAKTHACLCSWNELKDLQKAFGVDFQELDIRFLRNIPQIFGLVQDGQINISGIKYKLERN